MLHKQTVCETVVLNSRPQLTLFAFGRIWSYLVVFGRIWSYLVAFGRIRSHSVAYNKTRSTPWVCRAGCVYVADAVTAVVTEVVIEAVIESC